MAYKAPVYPIELTSAAWKSKRGTIAKMAAKDDGSALAKALDDLLARFKQIDWKTFDISVAAKGHGSTRTQKDIDLAAEEAKKQAAKVEAVYTTARGIELQAKHLGEDWAKSKIVPAASAKAALAVSAASNKFSYTVAPATISAELAKQKAEAEKGIATLVAERAKLVDKAHKALIDLVRLIKAKKIDLRSWPDVWKANVRMVGTVVPTLLKTNPELGNEWNGWKQHSNLARMPKTQIELDKWLDELEKIARSLGPKLDRIK